jgi:hypothetical protein
MSLQGPIVVITGEADGVLLRALESAGASPVLGTGWDRAPSLLERVTPGAILVSQAAPAADRSVLIRIAEMVAGFPLYTPVLACADEGLLECFPDALPIAADATYQRIVARLASALRVRMLHATVAQHEGLLEHDVGATPDCPVGDPLDDAAVLVTGRGRSYPGLTTAVGEHVGLIGALSVETAARYLNARHLDGIVIGEGFGPPTLEAFLIALSEDARFRDLPVALLPDPPPTVDLSPLANLERLAGAPEAVVTSFLPLVRQHAFEARLKRELASLDAKGLIDPHSGLFTIAAFLTDLDQTIDDAHARNAGLSLARFAFPPTLDQRTKIDAARLISRLARNVDFGCRAGDGSILLAFSTTELRHAHVIARRIASVLRHTMLCPAGNPGVQVDASVTLAALKPTDTIESLLARVSGPEPVAAA